MTISGDTIVSITSAQLKQINLIFAEHEMLKAKVPLLESKITNLETINSNWEQVDSLRLKQLNAYQVKIKNQEANIVKLKKASKVKNYWIGGTSIASVILAFLCVLK